jgi:CRP/FNR family cyclic AMP-dependent transcriptional regulator
MQASPAFETKLELVPFEAITPEDPLAYLPCSPINEYAAGQAIYVENQPATRIYLVVGGTVKISRQGNGNEVVVDVCQSDEFFGESALAGPGLRAETAVAIENTRVMSWSGQEIEEFAVLRPKLAMALLLLMVRRTVDFGTRMASFSAETIPHRLTRTLIAFGERFGTESEDRQSIRMDAFTHELLAQYIGTSREIVTHYMSQFRREGYVQYSREGIWLLQPALTEWHAVQRAAA